MPAPIVRANAPIRTTSDTTALYFLDTMHFSENWLLNVGLRFDRFSTKAPITYCPDLPGSICPRGYSGLIVSEDYRSTSNEVSGQIGLVWKPVPAGRSIFHTRIPRRRREASSAKARIPTRSASTISIRKLPRTSNLA